MTRYPYPGHTDEHGGIKIFRFWHNENDKRRKEGWRRRKFLVLGREKEILLKWEESLHSPLISSKSFQESRERENLKEGKGEWRKGVWKAFHFKCGKNLFSFHGESTSWQDPCKAVRLWSSKAWNKRSDYWQGPIDWLQAPKICSDWSENVVRSAWLVAESYWLAERIMWRA